MSYDKLCEECKRPMGSCCGYELKEIRFCSKCAKKHKKTSESAINRQLYTFHKAIIAIRDFCYLTDVIQSHSGYTKEIKGINKDAFKLAVRFMKYSSDRGVIYPAKKEASI